MNAWLPQASYPCDVPPQPNSPPDNVLRPDRPAEASLGSKRRGCYPASDSRIDRDNGNLVNPFMRLAVRRPGKAPERAVPSPSPGRHEAVRSRHVSGSSSPPTVDGFGLGPPSPALRANPFPEVTDPFCRLPLPGLFHRPEAVHLGDLMRL
ncbi:unnamed protein product [Brassica oleracea var. botrytis]